MMTLAEQLQQQRLQDWLRDHPRLLVITGAGCSTEVGIPDYRDAAGQWDFYMAYNLFRMASILHGIAQRAAEGTAAAEDAVETGRKAAPLADLGWEAAERYMAASN